MARNTSSDKGNFTPNEKLKYHLEKSRKGATGKNGKLLSDFARGRHQQKAENLIRAKDEWYSKNKDKISQESYDKHLLAKQKRYEKQKAYRESRKNSK